MLEWIRHLKGLRATRLSHWRVVAGWMLGLVTCSASWAQGSAVVTTQQVRAELIAHAPQGVQAGQPLWLGLQLTHQPGWHTYWQNPGDSGLPTQLEWHLPKGLQAGDVAWPLPVKLKAGSLTNYGYEHTATLVTPVTVSPQYHGEATLTVRLHANWLVCRLECIPQEGDFSLYLPTQGSHVLQGAVFDTVLQAQAHRLDAARMTSHFEGQQLVLQVRGLPDAMRGQHLQVFPATQDVLASAAEQDPLAQQAWDGDAWTVRLPQSSQRLTSPTTLPLLLISAPGAGKTAVEVVVPIQTPWPDVKAAPILNLEASPPPLATSWGFVLTLLGALLGGVVLNLMPCVLPVLAIKLMGLAQHSRQHRAHRVAGISYTVGVVLSCLALGGTVLALRALGEQLGWGFQLQSPWVVSALAVLFTLIALNLWGLFEVALVLPTRVMALQARHPVLDALLSGMLAVAVASPCTAPFMGASLGAALTLPGWQALLVFASLGLGLALPFLAVSLWPALVQWLPHPGPWMVTFRQLLGFPMLATVAWLLWVLGLQVSLTASTTLMSALLLLAAWLWTNRLHTLTGRVLRGLLLIALLIHGWLLQQDLRMPDAPTSTAAPATAPLPNAPTPSSHSTWQAWSQEAVVRQLSDGKPVFVDFTAAWCVTCQLNKTTTLANADVQAAFAAHQVTLLRADWTRRDPAISAALTQLGRSGVPVYVLYAPQRAPVVLSELLTPGDVLQALAELP